jgi:hypothetical protein
MKVIQRTNILRVILFILLILCSCGTVGKFERWEDVQQSEAGGYADLSFEDEFIDVTFLRGEEKEVRYRLRNKTDGRITILWDEVSWNLPSGAVMAVVRSDGAAHIIPAGAEVLGRISPVERKPYLADDDRWQDADGSVDSLQEFAVVMPLEIESLGGKKDYTFNFDLD